MTATLWVIRAGQGLVMAALVLSVWPALAQTSNRDLLKQLEEQKPNADIAIPGPKTSEPVAPPVRKNRTRALENLRNEEADRTQRQILEQLK